MKKVLVGAVIALASVLIYKSCTDSNGDKKILKENTMLIEQQIKNVSKLIVTEGHFAEVYNYADSKELFGPLITADNPDFEYYDVTADYLNQFDAIRL